MSAKIFKIFDLDALVKRYVKKYGDCW